MSESKRDDVQTPQAVTLDRLPGHVALVTLKGRGPELFKARGGFAGFALADRNESWIAAVYGKAPAGGCELGLACTTYDLSDSALRERAKVAMVRVRQSGDYKEGPRAALDTPLTRADRR